MVSLIALSYIFFFCKTYVLAKVLIAYLVAITLYKNIFIGYAWFIFRWFDVYAFMLFSKWNINDYDVRMPPRECKQVLLLYYSTKYNILIGVLFHGLLTIFHYIKNFTFYKSFKLF